MITKRQIDKQRRVFIALHLFRRPDCPAFWSSLEAGVKLLKQHGYTPYYGMVFGDVYISKARNELVSQFLKSNCGTFMFIADDLEYTPEDMLRVIQAPGDVVAGAYRLKIDDPTYPVAMYLGEDKQPVKREDGCLSAHWVQTGFLRINRCVFDRIVEGYPELAYYGLKDGVRVDVGHDFFPQGVHNHQWVGEDYAFCNLWTELGGKIWVVPDLTLTHYQDEKGYTGNFHEYLTQLYKKANK